MALILKAVAAVLTVIGAATLYWGTSPSLLSLGNTVMIVGAVVGSSGIVLFGLAAVLGQLQVLGAKLDALHGIPVAVPAAPAIVPAAPVVAEPAALDLAHPVAAPLVEPDLRPAPEPMAAPVSGPVAPQPPTRRSFGLPPLATQAPVVAGAAVAGLAAGSLAASAATVAPADKAADRVPPLEPAPVVEPPAVAPVVPEILSPEAEREKDVERAEEVFGDAKDEAPEDFRPMPASPELDHAVEDLKDELKAAEADLAPPVQESGADKDDAGSVDHLASLERLLLGAASADVRTPAEPDPVEIKHVRAEAPEPRVTADEPAPATSETLKPPAAEPAVSPALDTEDFMARLRETISRPVVAPTPLPDITPAPRVEITPEPPPAAPVASPVLSIEEELERALKASLEAPAPEPAKPVYVEPPRAEERPPFLRSAPPDMPKTPAYVPSPPAASPEPETRADPMAALARDFPELNDILAPRKPAADPADSLIEDLKGIFEPAPKPATRQEPVFTPPPPPPAVRPPLLREGVIATIPFRLYGDGTIEADLPEGTTQFASLKDFRAHVGG